MKPDGRILVVGAGVNGSVCAAALHRAGYDVTVLAGRLGFARSISALGTSLASRWLPKWIPLGPTFWAVLTGIAFVLAGVAIVSGVLDVLAARLLGLMLQVFSALALAPLIFASPRDHASWGANAYNLTAVGAAWVVAEWLSDRRQLVRNGQSAKSLKRSLA